MAEITVAQIGKLRQQTGAGMMDCKKALTENDGDLEAATEWLRKKGTATAEKKSSRTTSEGVIARHLEADGKSGTLVEINCETEEPETSSVVSAVRGLSKVDGADCKSSSSVDSGNSLRDSESKTANSMIVAESSLTPKPALLP